MSECNPPCFEGRGNCNLDTLTCACGWEYGEDDCSKTFYQLLGDSYLWYSLFAVTLSSLIFGFSGFVFYRSIAWKVTKLENPQKASLLILCCGSFGKSRNKLYLTKSS